MLAVTLLHRATIVPKLGHACWPYHSAVFATTYETGGFPCDIRGRQSGSRSDPRGYLAGSSAAAVDSIPLLQQTRLNWSARGRFARPEASGYFRFPGGNGPSREGRCTVSGKRPVQPSDRG